MSRDMKNSSLSSPEKLEEREKQQQKERKDNLPFAKSLYSPSSSPAAVSVMAVALSLATYLYNSYRFQGSDPVVQTTLGLVQGNLAKSREGRTYYEFLGVPYAEPPTGDLRFELPEPVKPWKGTRYAKSYGAECMQLEVMVTARVRGQENCLFLNVFSHLKTTKLLPVLFFLHGGLFMAGSSNMYRGQYYMDQDVVLVTVNYRKRFHKTPPCPITFILPWQQQADSKILNVRKPLVVAMAEWHGKMYSIISHSYHVLDKSGIFVRPLAFSLSSLGFLNTEDGIAKGNQGLWDQNLALHFVKENIARFGGDPNRVILAGESAGAASVHYHMLSPYSSGLFQRAISQSGTALQIWALSRSPKTQAQQLAVAMGCPADNTTAMVSCLKRVDATKLVKYHIASMSPIRQNTDLFVPSVDGDFLPAEPIELLKNGSFAKVPWMTGVNAGEGLLNTGRILAMKKISDNLWHRWNEWIPLMLDYDPNRFDISWKIKQQYFKNLANKPFEDATIANLTQIYSDRVYFLDSRKAALLHAQHAPVYLYYYSYPGELSFFRLFKAVMPSHNDIMAPELKIAVDVGKDIIKKYILRQSVKYLDAPCHADELILQFNTHRLFEISKNSKDYPVSRALVKSWADFAKNNWTLTYQKSQWTPVDPGSISGLHSPQYMNININGHMIPEPFSESIQFWQDLGF